MWTTFPFFFSLKGLDDLVGGYFHFLRKSLEEEVQEPQVCASVESEFLCHLSHVIEDFLGGTNRSLFHHLTPVFLF